MLICVQYRCFYWLLFKGTTFQTSDRRLAEAVRTAQRQSAGDAGWTLRNAMDTVLADARAGKPLHAPAPAAVAVAAPAHTPAPAAAAAAVPEPIDFSGLSLERFVVELKQANSTGTWDADAPRIAALCSAFCDMLPGGTRAWLTKISAVISLGVPLWNAGDYAACAAVYKAVATVFRGRHVVLARALLNSHGASRDAEGDSQGWILRDAFDELLGAHTTDDDEDDGDDGDGDGDGSTTAEGGDGEEDTDDDAADELLDYSTIPSE